MGCEYCKRNCSEYCDQNYLEYGRIISPILNNPNKEQKNEKITDLVDNLTGLTKEYSPKTLSSKSQTSSWIDSNHDHFEINIRYCHREKKLKVKKKYTISKVITKYIELENPEKVEGRLLKEGMTLDFIKTLGELGISENDTLDLF